MVVAVVGTAPASKDTLVIGILRTAPHVSIFPGLTILLTVLGLNLLGDGLRDVLDPQTVA
jgi:ABC-type dipeptide/oligopeptide/nickel transport system permease subunit